MSFTWGPHPHLCLWGQGLYFRPEPEPEPCCRLILFLAFCPAALTFWLRFYCIAGLAVSLALSPGWTYAVGNLLL